MSEEILPPGMDAQWQWYLSEQICPFCNSELAANMTSPLPSVPKPGSCADPPSTSIGQKHGVSHLESDTTPKLPRCCGYCNAANMSKTSSTHMINLNESYIFLHCGEKNTQKTVF